MSKLYVKNRYWQIPNEILNNPLLSLKAKGLWVYIQSKPEHWDFAATRMELDSKDWKKAIYAWLLELEETWLLNRNRIRHKDWTWEHEYYLLEPTTQNEPATTPKGRADKGEINKERNSNNIIIEKPIMGHGVESITSNVVNEKKVTPLIVSVRQHMQIVSEYEEDGTFNIEEIASKAVINTYEASGLNSLAIVFLDWCSWNHDKLEGKVNLKARFNKFVQTDYQWLLMRKNVWPGIDSITDEQFIKLLDDWIFANSSCEFYKTKVRPHLDTQGLNTFQLMIEFFKNRTVWDKNWLRFEEWLVKTGKIIA